MANFDTLFNNWLHNGMHDRATAVYERINSRGDGQDAFLYSQNLALIVYSFGLKEAFSRTPPPFGQTEGCGFLKHLFGCKENTLESIQLLAYNFKKLIDRQKLDRSDREAVYDFAGLLLRYYQYGLVNRDNENQFIYQAQKLAGVLTGKKYPQDFDNSRKADVINRLLGFNHSRAKSAQWRKEIPLYFRMAALIADRCPDPDTTIILSDNLRDYMEAKDVKIDETFIRGLEKNIIPAAICGHNPLLAVRGNLWGRYDFEYGIGDYTYKALTVKVCPAAVNELLMIAKELPASEYEPFAANRRDAITLNDGHFDSQLRNLVHDQRPGIGALIAAMVDYFDAGESGDADRLKTAAVKLTAAIEEIDIDLKKETLFARQNYLEVLNRSDNPEIRETAIEILRRMKQNMSRSSLSKPQCGKTDIQAAIDRLDSGQNFIDHQDLELVLGFVNQNLIKAIQQKEVGLSPQKLQLISWCEQKCIKALNHLDYEHQYCAYTDRWFRQTVIFNELINTDNGSFNLKSFNRWYDEEIAAEPPLTAYHKLAARQNENLAGLCQKYKKIGLTAERRLQRRYPGDSSYKDEMAEKIRRQTRKRTEIIGSGLLKQLQNLTTFRPASTRAGEQDRKQRLSDNWFEVSQLLSRSGKSFESN